MPIAGKHVDFQILISRNGSKMAHRVFLNVFGKNDVISNLLHRNEQPRQQQHQQQRRQHQHRRQQQIQIAVQHL